MVQIGDVAKPAFQVGYLPVPPSVVSRRYVRLLDDSFHNAWLPQTKALGANLDDLGLNPKGHLKGPPVSSLSDAWRRFLFLIVDLLEYQSAPFPVLEEARAIAADPDVYYGQLHSSVYYPGLGEKPPSGAVQAVSQPPGSQVTRLGNPARQVAVSQSASTAAYTPDPETDQGLNPLPGLYPSVYGTENAPLASALAGDIQESWTKYTITGQLSLPSISWPGQIEWWTYPVSTPNPSLYLIETYRTTLIPLGSGAGSLRRARSVMPSSSADMPSIAPLDGAAVAGSLADCFTFGAGLSLVRLFRQTELTGQSIPLRGLLAPDLAHRSGWAWALSDADPSDRFSLNSGRSSYARLLLACLRNHLDEANLWQRELSDRAKSTLSTSTQTATTTASSDSLSNLNGRRSLDFLFAELNEAFEISVTLEDIRVGFSNGRLMSWNEAPLTRLPAFLGQLVSSPQLETLGLNILEIAASVYDAGGHHVPTLAAVKYSDTISYNYAGPRVGVDWPEDHVWRITNEKGQELPSVLLATGEGLLRGRNRVADTRLGELDALDKYALAVQDADATDKDLHNKEMQVRLDALGAVTASDQLKAISSLEKPDGALHIDLSGQ